MYLGKKKCRTLKKIRKQIAEANGITYSPNKCTHRGDCEGTCPACEQEMRHLESEIRRRRLMGRAAVVVGTALGISALTAGVSSCRNAGQVVGKFPVVGDVPATVDSTEIQPDSVDAKTIDTTAHNS